MKLRKALLKFVSKESPKEMRLKAAQGLVEMAPADLVSLFFILSYDGDEEVSRAATRSFDGLPSETLLKALEGNLDPLVVKKIAAVHRENEGALRMVALNENTDEETILDLASTGPESVVKALLGGPERLRKNPLIREALKKNPLAPTQPMEEAPELAEVKKQGPAPTHKIEDSEEKPASEDTVHQNTVEEEFPSLVKQIEDMTVGQKIKLALTGDKDARGLLLKDSNKQITTSVLRNPRITEEEVLKLTSTKGTPDDILRLVAKNKEWMKNYKIKYTLVLNPRTPFKISMKLISQLQDKDLANISRSKNIPGVLSNVAMKTLETRKRH
jgi:hypothetical protein